MAWTVSKYKKIISDYILQLYDECNARELRVYYELIIRRRVYDVYNAGMLRVYYE